MSADLVTVLEQATIRVIGRMPNSSNATLLVEICGTDLRGIYKPLAGERPLWDFDPGLYLHEVAAWRLSEALGWGLVPPTVVCQGPHGEGSLQLFVEFNGSEHYFTLLENHPDLHDDLRRMAILDIIANNTDRKGGHVLLGLDGRLWGIDHGVCFSPEFKLRTVIWDFAGETIPDEWIAAFEPWTESVPDTIAEVLTHDEVEAMRERIGWLVDNRVLPAPESRYQYPWPVL
ncbi:MAG: SCO1664 family protein [Actinobacteria bacterium]|nr:SCO1664 family protein [Actinomycetota bacterium]